MTDVEKPIVLPALLRAARNTYAAKIRAALNEAGFIDIPRNGIYVLGGLLRNGAPLGQLVRELGVTKQAAGQLVDTLVLRGYLVRTPDEADRRRLNIALTERGQAAAEISGAVVDGLEAALLARLGEAPVAQARLVLHTLAAMRGEAEEEA